MRRPGPASAREPTGPGDLPTYRRRTGGFKGEARPGPDYGEAMAAAPLVTRTRSELAEALAAAPAPRATVMTMGALHEGHLDLVREAARRVGAGGTVVVTIFVNQIGRAHV